MPNSKKEEREKAKKYDRAKMLANARARNYKARKSEEQLAKKREQDRISAQNRRKHVKNMSEKEKKDERKAWRERKRNQRKRQNDTKELLENTPPLSEEEFIVQQTVRDRSRQSEAGKKIARRNKLKIIKELKDAKTENEKLLRQLQKYKKRLVREKNKNKAPPAVSPSPGKKLKQFLGTERVSPKIRKKLFSAIVLEKQLKNQVQSISAKSKLRQIMIKTVGNAFLKKYRLQQQFKSIVPYTYNKVLATKKPSLEYDKKPYETMKVKEALVIRQFYEDDMVSRIMPGKKDYVQRGKIKMQRRVLLDSLNNLYDKFVEEAKITNVSRSVFYRCRPWWVFRPKLKDRETCACVKHENVAFIFSALKTAKVIHYKDVDDLMKNLVCSVKNEKCMLGLCRICKDKTFDFKIEENKEIKFNKWQTITENKLIKGTVKPIKQVTKTSLSKKAEQLVELFKETLVPYKKHVLDMCHQAKMLKNFKRDLKENEILYQVDFSQNYMAKFTSEVQSVHFGASQKQISLHTGAKYVKKEDDVVCSTFCTVSDNLDHHAHGVWSHLKDILNQANHEYPKTDAVHFFTDSPSSQYRNKTNVYLMSLLLPEYFKNLQSFSWNFSEAGHGKGVMDGVGGSIKRNSDLLVLHQNDITCAKDLVQLFSKSKTDVLEVPSDTFNEIKSLIPPTLDPIEGIMSVKQITWSKHNDILQFRRLSCFDCPPDVQCQHYHLFSIAAKNGKVISSQKATTALGKKIRSKKEVKPKKKKNILKVSDVYSDEEDNVPEPVKLKENFDYEDLKQGVFIVVSFPVGGKKNTSKDFVAVIQSTDNLYERELNVMFMKRYRNDQSLFFPDESDESYISVEQIKGILPEPEPVLKGFKRVYQKFSGSVFLN